MGLAMKVHRDGEVIAVNDAAVAFNMVDINGDDVLLSVMVNGVKHQCVSLEVHDNEDEGLPDEFVLFGVAIN